MAARLQAADPPRLALLRVDFDGGHVIADGAVSRTATCLHSGAPCPTRPKSGGERLPLGQGGRASLLELVSADKVALRVEVIVEGSVD